MSEGLVVLLLVGFVMLFLVRTIERIEQSYAKQIADGRPGPETTPLPMPWSLKKRSIREKF